jgi:choline-phosphate cytidylyltransferase
LADGSSHVRFLERAKRAFPNTWLIVGVIGDEEVRKIGAIAILTSAERAEVVRSCKHVDEVIEDCPAVLNPDFVTPLRIDFFGRSEGWQCGDTADPYKFSALQSKSFEIPMTETISSADIISRIANVRDSLGRYTANMQ